MRITEEIWEDLPVKDGWVMLPDGGARFRNNCLITPPCEIGAASVIESGCVIGAGCIIGLDCRIGAGCKIGAGCVIGDRAVIEDNCDIGFGCMIGWGSLIENGCKLKTGCMIGPFCRIPKNTTIYVIELSYPANYSGIRDGEKLFRLGSKIYPLSWFLTSYPGSMDSFEIDGMTAEEYRRYLRFFNEETERLGIQQNQRKK